MLSKIETCSWTLLLKIKNSQLTANIAFLMEVISSTLGVSMEDTQFWDLVCNKWFGDDNYDEEKDVPQSWQLG